VTSTTQVANLNAATAGTATSATTAGTVTTAAQPNITSVGTLTGLTSGGVVNFTTASNVSLGSNANVKLTGGSAGYFLSTDGSGNLTWATPAAGAYVFTQSVAATTWTINHNLGYQYVNIQVIDSTGNSYTGRYNYPTITFNNTTHCTVTFSSAQAGYAAVTSGGGQTGPQGPSGSVGGANTNIQFNDAGSPNGSANFTFDKTTNLLTVAGNITTSGQLRSTISTGTAPLVVASTTQVANLNAATAGTATSATTAGTVTTAAQPNITSVGTLSSLAVTGNISGANLTGTHYGAATGLTSIPGGNVTGTVANATFATSAGSATTAGTVTTAAQPNITSTGTLTALTVSGNTFLATSSGRVGIGITDPGYRLDVAAADTTAGLGYALRLRSNATATAAALQFTNSAVSAENGLIACTDAGLITIQGSGNIAFRANGEERMRVTNAGYLEATYSDKVVALGNSGTATSIDLRQGTVFTATLTGNCTFTLTNPNANASRGSSFTLILTNDGTAGRTVAWAGGSFKFPGGAAAVSRTTTANAVDVWVFFTPDGGVTWYGNISMKDVKA
jgi:hypothetical protein